MEYINSVAPVMAVILAALGVGGATIRAWSDKRLRDKIDQLISAIKGDNEPSE